MGRVRSPRADTPILAAPTGVTAIEWLSLSEVLATLGSDGRLVHVERLAARAARTASLTRALPDPVAARFVDPFWEHQARAIDLARAGTPVVVATGTASGKSRCFQAPIAEAVADPIRPATALAIFPTKALAHDQLRALSALDLPRMVPAAYDGDCTTEERAWVRRNANVVLTNPEMLHSALLPHHTRWATFLMRLRYVVLDELHAYRGIFGTHVGHVLRRLRRICAHYRSSPTFIACSATIGSPETLGAALWGDPVTAVTDDASPCGERVIALWNPPLVDDLIGRGGPGDPPDSVASGRPRPSGRARVSTHGETAAVVAELVSGGHRTIAFCRSRRGVEVVAGDVRRRLPEALAERVCPYRGGYLPSERREIEDRLFGGRLDAVVATNALELGIDVGGIRATVLDGFPGTIASFWQQAGRAGRSGEEALAVLVAGEDQLDQWLMAHPRELLSRQPEPAVVNPANPFVLHPHLACAAFELPLTPADERWWPDLLDDGVRSLVLADWLKVRRGPRAQHRSPVAVWSGTGYPAHRVALRSGSSRQFRIARVDGSAVGTVDEARAFEMVHPGAVYVHQGAVYRVIELDLDALVAVVEPYDESEYTMARTDLDVTLGRPDARRRVGRSMLHLGPVEIESRVTAYQRRDPYTGEVIGTETLELPPSRLVSRGAWYVIDERDLLRARIEPAAWPGSLHAAEHAAIGILPLFTICDRWDVGGVSSVALRDTGAPTILIYDAHPGGAGIAELAYGVADHHLAATLDVIRRCACGGANRATGGDAATSGGCPSCVQSPKCGNWNEPLDAAGAARLLGQVLDLEG